MTWEVVALASVFMIFIWAICGLIVVLILKADVKPKGFDELHEEIFERLKKLEFEALEAKKFITTNSLAQGLRGR